MASFTVNITVPIYKDITYHDNFGKTWTLTETNATSNSVHQHFLDLVTDDALNIASYEKNVPNGNMTDSEIRSEYNKKLSDFESAWKQFVIDQQQQKEQKKTDTSPSNLAFFQDDSILTEEVMGLKVDESGIWKQDAIQNPEQYLKQFASFEQSVATFKRLIHKGKIEEKDGSTTAVTDNISSVGPDGTVVTKKQVCPYCGKEVDQLLQNGYCSKSCATKARLERQKSKISAAGQKTLDIIKKIRDKLKMLDMGINLLSDLPDMIKGKAQLPKEYRDYITLRIDVLFLELKKLINYLMIKKNEALIELLKKVKFGDLDAKLSVIFQPIQTIIKTVSEIQKAANIAIAAVIALLKTPASGISPQSYGWLATAKSEQYPAYTGKLFIEIIPKANLFLDFPNKLNIINYEKIESIVRKIFPPIQDVEYFLDPTAFQVRYLLSADNAPRVKKLIQSLEGLIVFGADTFPRWKRLKLSNVWFVLSILTGWGPTSKGVFGDYVIHGAV